EVVALRRVRLSERAEALAGEPVDLERLLVLELAEVDAVPERRDHQVTRRVRELVQEHDPARPTVDDEALLVVAGSGEAADTALLLVRRLDVLEAPGRPQRLRHSGPSTSIQRCARSAVTLPPSSSRLSSPSRRSCASGPRTASRRPGSRPTS